MLACSATAIAMQTTRSRLQQVEHKEAGQTNHECIHLKLTTGTVPDSLDKLLSVKGKETMENWTNMYMRRFPTDKFLLLCSEQMLVLQLLGVLVGIRPDLCLIEIANSVLWIIEVRARLLYMYTSILIGGRRGSSGLRAFTFFVLLCLFLPVWAPPDFVQNKSGKKAAGHNQVDKWFHAVSSGKKTGKKIPPFPDCPLGGQVLQVNLQAMAARQRLHKIGVAVEGVKLGIAHGQNPKISTLFELPEHWIMSDSVLETVLCDLFVKLSLVNTMSEELMQGECERR